MVKRNVGLVLHVGAIAALFCLAGCAGVDRPRPGLSTLRVVIDAKPKAGYRESASSAYGTDDTGPLVRPGFERTNYKGLRDVVVVVEPAPANAATPLRAELRASSLALHSGEPPVFLASAGGAIAVFNDTPTPIDLFSVSAGNVFDLGTVSAGGRAEAPARAIGVVEMLSSTRDEPVALVFVSPSALAAQGGSGKSVVFRDLPPGRYSVSAWHARLPTGKAAVDLSADAITTARIVVGVRAIAATDAGGARQSSDK